MYSVLSNEFNEDVFRIYFLTDFDNSDQIGIPNLPYKENVIITQNTLRLEGIIVLLRDIKSKVWNIWYMKLHCKCIGQRVRKFFLPPLNM